jgi:acyl carrier protein
LELRDAGAAVIATDSACGIITPMNQDEALSWMAGVLEAPAGSFGPLTAREEIRGWDSLGMLMLMADLDEKFKIQIAEQEIKTIVRVEDILNLLRKHGALAS